MERSGCVAPSKGLVVSVRQLPHASTTLSAKTAPEAEANTSAQPLPTIPSAGNHDSRSFFKVFGPFGIPMALIAVICIIWTAFLIGLTVKPNTMANYLMNTAEFDNGTFWLITEPDTTLLVISVLALGVIAFSYIDMLLQMTPLRSRKKYSRISQSPLQMAKARTLGRLSSIEVVNKRMLRRWTTVNILFGYGSKYWNLWLKMADLTIQTLSLYQLLERGYPQILVYCYAGLVVCNAFVYAAGVLAPRYHSAFGDIFMDLIFDILLAVAFPVLVFAYSSSHFKLDREVLLLNMKIFPVGSFENIARMASDPAQIALFRLLFDSLRIQTPMDFLLRTSMNLSICYRFKSVVRMLVQSRKRFQFSRRSFSQNTASTGTAQHSPPRSIAVVFLVFGASLLVSVHQAVSSSKAVCEPYPECVAYAYRWHTETSKSYYCPCIALIDDIRVPTQNDWDYPVNVTDKVRHLSMSGKLQVLQIINRRLVDLPDALQQCTDLRHMTLMYTDTRSLPSWAKRFRKLEYFHIEGRPAATNILTLPDNLFTSMTSLTFIHLAGHSQLEQLPSFQGLYNLKSLSLADLFSVKLLPSFTSMRKLERLEMLALVSLSVLPDLASLKRLVYFALLDRGTICCNGFLGSQCNLSHPFCQANTHDNYPQATCLSATDMHASIATLKIFHRFASSVCVAFQSIIGGPVGSGSGDGGSGGPGDEAASHAEPVSAQGQTNNCNNVANRRCPPESGGTEGICVSTHMQVISCEYSTVFKTVRRMQIARGIGTPCNPEEESWLGCNRTV